MNEQLEPFRTKKVKYLRISYSEEKDEVAKMWFQLYSATLRDIRHTCHEKVDSVVSFVGGGESVDRQKVVFDWSNLCPTNPLISAYELNF